jgi:ABC-type glutathione transport system ATPase component
MVQSTVGRPESDRHPDKPPLSLQNVHVSYATRRGKVQAVRNVSVDLHAGESLALIG